MANCKIYRFKFSDDVTKLLADFANLHLFDSKDQLKTCFEELWEENLDVFKADLERLTELGMDGGYDGYKTRVFRSMKYYHIKKIKKENGESGGNGGNVQSETTVSQQSENKKKEKKQRFSKSMIEAIETSILEEMKTNTSFKPSSHIVSLFDNPEFKIIMQEEQRRFRIIEQDKRNKEDGNNGAAIDETEFVSDFNTRVKKLYQNRYFNISSNVQ